MTGQRRGRWCVLAALLAGAAAGGCGAPATTTPPGATPDAGQGATTTNGGGEELDRLRRQARAALDRYDQVVKAAGGTPGIVVISSSTGQIGDWEPAATAFKESLGAGKVAAVAPLPGPPSAEGDVVWDAGGRRTVAIMTAGKALEALVGEGRECPRCETIQVTGARLGTVRIETATGAATAPAWQFTIKGSAVLVTRLAFAGGVTVQPPPWDADNPPGGLRIDAATVTGTTLTAQFVGAPQPATQPCGIDYTAEAVASANAVVVIVLAHPFPSEQPCLAIGAPRTATMRLAEPLGARAVLEVQQGTPVPVTVG